MDTSSTAWNSCQLADVPPVKPSRIGMSGYSQLAEIRSVPSADTRTVAMSSFHV